MAKLWTEATADAMKVSAEALKDGTVQSLDSNRAARPAPSPPAERDAAIAAEIAAQERAARDAARLPYRAPDPPAVAVARMTGLHKDGEALQLLAANGLSARPDLVFGAFRTPDLWSPRSNADKRREWLVLHDPAAASAAVGPEVHETVLEAGKAWVQRDDGDPAPVDEEVGALFAARAGLEPEQLLGVSREIRWSSPSEGVPEIEQRGVRVLHTTDERSAKKALAAEGPAAWPSLPHADVHLELLWWADIRHATRESAEHEPQHPSPDPRLPLEVDELLVAYLEIVGVAPGDCLGVGAGTSRTETPNRDGRKRGAARRHVTDLVTILYRERSEHAAGRERWARYCAEQLGRTLTNPHPEHGGERYPVQRRGRGRRTLGGVYDLVDPIGQVGTAPYTPAYC
jgi:hypothetical protein